jgi:AhpD family alkylhydroperoxidase
MQTIQSIPIEDIDGSTLRLLALENAQRGSSKTICNMYLAMAASPRALEGYAEFRHALAGGKLSPRLREQIALVVAQANHCDYSLAQHVSDAVDLGMNTEEIQNARRARANDAKTLAALQVARDLVSRSAEGPQAARSLRDVG